MTSSSSRRKIVVLLVAVVLTAPWLFAEEQRASPERDYRWSLPSISEIWNTLTALWEQNGCKLDPYGGCTGSPQKQPPSTPTGDEGCTIDPSGGCRG